MAIFCRGRRCVAIVVAWAFFSGGPVQAVDYSWNVLGGGAQTWQTAANWSPSTNFPNASVDYANLAVPLTGALNVDLGATPVTLGRLDIGSTGSAVATDVVGAGAYIRVFNTEDADFDDNNQVNGHDFLIWQQGLSVGTTNATGDANLDALVTARDLKIWKELYRRGGGVGRVTSGGVAGATNRVSVPVVSGMGTSTETIEVFGSNSLHLAGGYRVEGSGNTISSFMTNDAVLRFGSVSTLDHLDGTTPQPVSINSAETAAGRIEINGVTGPGNLAIGNTSNNGVMSTISIGGNNTTFTGNTTQNRSNLILTSDQALGTGTFGQGNPTQRTGFNLMSDSNDRKIGNVMRLVQWQTVTGENSLEWAGVIAQDNSRGLINLLPAGRTLTLSGSQFAVTDDDLARTIVYDGTGNTVVTGSVKATRYVFATGTENSDDGIVASLTKQGSGSLHLNGVNSYTGATVVNGGNLHFGIFDDTINTSSIQLNFGAVGADAFSTGGVPDTLQTNGFFLSRLAFNSSGGLMINASDAAATFDFTAETLGILSASGATLSLAAPETGRVFTGTIVPADATYRLGGGSGTLTLPNAQLTGANKLVVTNGGVVQLDGANTYSGTTTIQAKYTTSLVAQALVGGVANNANLNRVYAGTVLAVSNLQNGGLASSIGNSSSDGANLVIQGSTLRYTGAGATTDRLFTVGTGGATIEGSGTVSGVIFSNTGNLVMDAPAARMGTKAGTTTISGLSSTADLVIGMGVSGPGIAANTTITDLGPTSITLSAAATDSNTDSITFTAIARTLRLGGTNKRDNTLRPNITNGAAATNVVKADEGTWILTGNNTYTGTTTVTAGTLFVNGVHTGGGAYTVASAATLAGTGSIGANITSSGVIAPGPALNTLAVVGNVTLAAGSTTLFEIGGTGAGQHDELNITGALTAGGTFKVELFAGVTLAAGNSFDLLDFGSASGSFAFSLPALGPGLAWNTSNVLTTGTISVVAGAVAIPEPSGVVLVMVCMGLLAGRLRNR